MAYENRGEDDGASLGLRFRRALVKSTGLAVAMVVGLVLYALVGGQGSLDRLFGALSITQSTHIGSYVLGALIAFTLVVRISCNNLNMWSTESEVDSFHRRHNSSSMINLAIIGMLIYDHIGRLAPGEVPPLDHLIFAALFLLLLAGEIVFGPLSSDPDAREAFKDEFYRAMRAKANRAGFAVVMLAGCAALLLLNWYQGQAEALLCSVLYAGGATSLLYYDYLIWRADRGR